MNVYHTSSQLRTLISCLLLVGSALPSLYAQTVSTPGSSAASSTTLRAIVRPDRHRSGCFNVFCESRSYTQLTIRDKNQKEVYSAPIPVRNYAARLNVSALPYGEYTVELRNHQDHFAQTFRIEPPVDGRIVLLKSPLPIDSLLAERRK
ncbi:hypothetical protein DYU11_09265 [Fibrisoma montanum]|uniref:Uncharacterized protein n=1 Tax=Fibrisoma montanum TaxID=2305895 RepID=A0A418MFD8_9BACT|nr:hypothetical protein [Fibrisoma montanum]RIV25475.1 hypothetical protein DYU11_09265 [Fibrisoma montanum]